MLSGILLLILGQFASSAIVVPFSKFGIQYFSPTLFVFFRFLIAFLCFSPIFFFHKKETLSSTEYKGLFIAGLLLAANVTIFTIGLQYTTALMSQLLYTLTPIIVGFLGHVFLNERITKEKIFGLVIAVIGVFFLLYQSFIKQQHLSFGTPFGNLLVLIAVFCYSLWILYTRILNNRKKYTSPQITFFTFGFVVLILAIVNFFQGTFFTTVNHAIPDIGIGTVILVGIGNVFSYFFLQLGIKRTNAFSASLISYLSPILTAIVSIPLLHEQPTISLFIGGFLIMFGVFYATTLPYVKRYLVK